MRGVRQSCKGIRPAFRFVFAVCTLLCIAFLRKYVADKLESELVSAAETLEKTADMLTEAAESLERTRTRAGLSQRPVNASAARTLFQRSACTMEELGEVRAAAYKVSSLRARFIFESLLRLYCLLVYLLS